MAGAEYDLVASPRGPNLYAGGQGTFLWGTDWTYQMACPEMWVAGTLRRRGETGYLYHARQVLTVPGLDARIRGEEVRGWGVSERRVAVL